MTNMGEGGRPSPERTRRTGSLGARTLPFYSTDYPQDDIPTKVDRASVIHSQETGVPFLDIELVALVRRRPCQDTLRSVQTKHLLKKTIEPELLKDILYRSKTRVGVPIDSRITPGALRLRSIHPAALTHPDGQSDERRFLWATLAVASFADGTPLAVRGV